MLKKLDIGVERLGNSAADEPYSALEGYRGRYDGRAVTLDFHDPQADGQIGKTRIATVHDGESDGVTVVRNRDKSPGGPDELPDEVDVAGGAFAEQFTVYFGARAIARNVVDDERQDPLLERHDADDELVELLVEENRVAAMRWERLLDTAIAERYLAVVCQAADRIETVQ